MNTSTVDESSENVGSPVSYIESTSNDPLVSVVIPCYNYAHFLSDAISSVLAQTIRDYEIIVVDDGSTDDTPAVARQFGSRVRYHRKPNGGLAAARNTGTKLSRGQFILYLDADDTLLPTALETGIALLEERPSCAFISGANQMIVRGEIHLPSPKRVTGDHYSALLRGNYIQMPGSVLYRRNLVSAEGGFDPSLDPLADYDLYLRLARRHPVFHHDKLVGIYRVHNANMSADNFLMLRYSLRVLFSQWPYARNDRHLQRAFLAGMICWLRIYGPRTIATAILPKPCYSALRFIVALARTTVRLGAPKLEG
jgi:glycosyltransferase involved in cell wall biosynthesis